ncbi:MAG: hypothetical protein ACRD3S_09580, partial [Terracidiphilus sp.]
DLGGACSDVRCTNNVAAYRAYLGSVYGGTRAFPAFFGGTGQTVAADGSNISNTAIAMLQAPGVVKGGYNQGFYFASAQTACGLACVPVAISDPTRATENQYIANSEYVINSKHSLYARYMYQRDPTIETFNCFILVNNCNPGAPINAYYGNHVGSLELQSVLTPNFVNQARFSFHRDVENNTDPNASLNGCSLPNGGSIIPLVNNGAACGTIPTPALAKRFSQLNEPPMLDILGIGSAAWSQGGNFSMISSNFIDTFQFGDQISWNHGAHAIRAAFEGQRIRYNNTIPAAGRGELLMYSTADFLTSSAGINAQDPTYNDGTPQTTPGGIAAGFALKGPLTHY